MIFFSILLIFVINLLLSNYGKSIIKLFITLHFFKLKLFEIKQTNIAVTGSYGKTTTCYLLYHILKKKTNVKLHKNNSLIGIPLSLLNIDVEYWKTFKNKKIKWYYLYLKLIFNLFTYFPKEKINIIEVGIDEVGGMDKHLINLPKINISIITKIDYAHSNNFISIDQIADEKFKLINRTDKNDLVIYNSKCIHSNKRVKQLPHKNKFGLYDKLKILDLKSEFNQLFVKYNYENNQDFEILLYNNNYLLPSFLSQNIGFCILACKYLNFEVTSQDLIGFKIEDGRCNIIKTSKFKIIDSSYNSSFKPLSLLIEEYNKINHSKKVLIIGDMLELGEKSHFFHNQIIKIVDNNEYYKVFFVGENFYKFINKKYCFYKNIESLIDDLNLEDLEYSLILVKGSYSVNLKKVIKILTD